MDQIQDLQSPSALQSFISETTKSADSPIALIQFYNGQRSIQWAASTVFQNQQIVQKFSKELTEGSLIFGRIDGSILPRGTGGGQYRLDTDLEVSYGIWWQGKQQVYEVDALGRGATDTIQREVQALLEMRRGMVDGERTRADSRRRAVVVGESKRWWSIPKVVMRPGSQFSRRGARARRQCSDES
ncbi:hypothetical protein TWF718_009258 [Orbilia javanica]|uniref:Uncharacterized protein n=1 Tax=Orbilia javanica TaxID=47235 RepID=A0AAN8MLX3_9PEZI